MPGRDDCSFSLDHYRTILEAARAGGYRLAGFDRPPERGDLILRHDVDLSLQAAVRMAEVEAELGVWSTWFLMTRSVFYNLLSDEGEKTIARLRELGGRIAHHGVWPHVDLDDRFDRVVAWHNPDRTYLSDPIEGATNAMEPPWYEPSHFRSDSNQSWARDGRPGRCPHVDLRNGDADWLHLNLHPEIWVYEGDTMQDTMESFLADEQRSRREHLQADRIRLS
jgi:hypothetical protein